MQINYQDKTIIKPNGIRTPVSRIGFDELNQYIKIYREVVDVQSPTVAVSAWVRNDFPEEQVAEVLYAVIVSFGGGHRIWGRFKEEYHTLRHEINGYLRYAYSRRNDDVTALRAILKNIRGLGSLSYSTKMLRFLNPDFVVLDSILKEEFCLTDSDYDTFATHCRQIAKILGVNAVDIESGLYAYVQINNPNQRQNVWRHCQVK